MGDRKIVKTLPTVLKSEHDEKEYPVDMVREAWTKSGQGNMGFAKRFGLNKAQLEELIRKGNWEEYRLKWRETQYRTFAKDRLENMEWRQGLINMMESFELMGIEEFLSDMAEHIKTTGSLKLRNEQGDIVRDGFGNPLIRGIPAYIKEALEETHKLRETNTKILVETVINLKEIEEKTESIDTDVVDLEALAENKDVSDDK